MSGEIRLEGVHLSYGARPVLTSLDLRVAAGETLALLGPSGSGKTSILRVMLGFASPHRGTVRIGDRVVSREGRVLVPVEERGLAVVFQDLALWPHLTVAGNVSFGLEARRVPAAERRERIGAMLRSVGLEGCERRFPGELSGGQRQRVAIARALVLRPRAVLLDEPLASVDVDLRRELLALFRELFAAHGATVLYASHDLREADAVASRVAVVEGGRIVQECSLEQLTAAPKTPFARSVVDDLLQRRS